VDDFANNVLEYVRQNQVQTDEHWTKKLAARTLRVAYPEHTALERPKSKRQNKVKD